MLAASVTAYPCNWSAWLVRQRTHTAIRLCKPRPGAHPATWLYASQEANTARTGCNSHLSHHSSPPPHLNHNRRCRRHAATCRWRSS